MYIKTYVFGVKEFKNSIGLLFWPPEGQILTSLTSERSKSKIYYIGSMGIEIWFFLGQEIQKRYLFLILTSRGSNFDLLDLWEVKNVLLLILLHGYRNICFLGRGIQKWYYFFVLTSWRSNFDLLYLGQVKKCTFAILLHEYRDRCFLGQGIKKWYYFFILTSWRSNFDLLVVNFLSPCPQKCQKWNISFLFKVSNSKHMWFYGQWIQKLNMFSILTSWRPHFHLVEILNTIYCTFHFMDVKTYVSLVKEFKTGTGFSFRPPWPQRGQKWSITYFSSWDYKHLFLEGIDKGY